MLYERNSNKSKRRWTKELFTTMPETEVSNVMNTTNIGVHGKKSTGKLGPNWIFAATHRNEAVKRRMAITASRRLHKLNEAERARQTGKKLEQSYTCTVWWWYSAHFYLNKFTGNVRNYICNSFAVAIIAGPKEWSEQQRKKKVLVLFAHTVSNKSWGSMVRIVYIIIRCCSTQTHDQHCPCNGLQNEA